MRQVPSPSTGTFSPVLSVTVRICRSLFLHPKPH
jgi:hypothetical protein